MALTSKNSCTFLGSTGMGRPSGPSGAFRMGFWYMLCSRMVGLMVGRLCRREQRSPWRQALQVKWQGPGAGPGAGAAAISVGEY